VRAHLLLKLEMDEPGLAADPEAGPGPVWPAVWATLDPAHEPDEAALPRIGLPRKCFEAFEAHTLAFAGAAISLLGIPSDFDFSAAVRTE